MLNLTVYLETGKLLLLWPTCLSGLSRASPLAQSLISECVHMYVCALCVVHVCMCVCRCTHLNM